MDGEPREQLRIEGVEVEAARAVLAAEGVREAARRQCLHAVDARRGEGRPEASYCDLPAFAARARDGDTRNALQRLREVQIREIGDVLGDDHVDRAV